MKDYDIAVSNTPIELRTEVKEMITKGFMPQGGVAVETRTWANEREGHEESENWYFQAMIKE